MAHASLDMPYFIKPSLHLSKEEKVAAYEKAISEIVILLKGETDRVLKMVTINCLLKTNLPYCYWVGFYVVSDKGLSIGPYQGTLGCLHIGIGKGVCGKAAETKTTQIVNDVHELSQGDEHIACDPNSHSEIVVPVMDSSGELIAVFDVDSTLTNSFDEVDQENLEYLMREVFAK